MTSSISEGPESPERAELPKLDFRVLKDSFATLSEEQKAFIRKECYSAELNFVHQVIEAELKIAGKDPEVEHHGTFRKLLINGEHPEQEMYDKLMLIDMVLGEYDVFEDEVILGLGSVLDDVSFDERDAEHNELTVSRVVTRIEEFYRLFGDDIDKKSFEEKFRVVIEEVDNIRRRILTGLEDPQEISTAVRKIDSGMKEIRGRLEAALQ